MIINKKEKKNKITSDFNLYSFVKITKKKKKLGRGDKTAGRGTKGQKARKSGRVRIGFEGGQNPFYLRFPKKGESRKLTKKKRIEIINLKDIKKNNETFLDFTAANNNNKKKKKIKILGNGDLEKAEKGIVIKSNFFSSNSIKKIESYGGSCLII